MKLDIHREVPRRHRDRRCLATYLKDTPVGWLSIFLRVGAPYYEATMFDLGSARTIFNHPENGHKQTVRECAENWIPQRKKLCSMEAWEKLTRYTHMLENGHRLDVIITVVRWMGRGYFICDGNHRAISCYKAGMYAVPIHLIDLRWPE